MHQLYPINISTTQFQPSKLRGPKNPKRKREGFPMNEWEHKDEALTIFPNLKVIPPWNPQFTRNLIQSTNESIPVCG